MNNIKFDSFWHSWNIIYYRASFIFSKKAIKKCPEPESNQWHEDFQSSALPTELSGHWVAGTGFEPMTFGLWARRASRLLHPALPYDIVFNFFQNIPEREWMEVDSNHRSKLQQIYSLSPLATRESIHIHFSMNKADDRTRTDNLLITNQLLCQLSHIGASFQHIFWNMGPIGLEPMTLCL